ncbi:MAG: hypothetical protein WCK89_21150, partial [bacterium]
MAKVFSMARCWPLAAAMGVLVVGRGWSAEPRQGAAARVTPGPNLVRAALESELAGRNDDRKALLRQALRETPDDGPAHWHSGQVRYQNAWLAPVEVEILVAQDRRLSEYGRLRDKAAPTVAEQAALARWCRKKRLADEERVHWLAVLELQPDNVEAMKTLGLRPFLGLLLTARQVEQLKAHLQKARQAADGWRPLVGQWRSAMERGESTSRDVVRQRLSTISDPAEMLGMEQDLWRQVGAKHQPRLYHAMILELMHALRGNPHPAAAESLARHAVFAEHGDVRAAAIAGLKPHPFDHYVPLLLSGLQTPIDADVRSTAGATGHPIVRYSLWREGLLTDT